MVIIFLASTRFLYEKKLAKLKSGNNSMTNGNDSVTNDIRQEPIQEETAEAPVLKNGDFSADDEVPRLWRIDFY